MRREEALVICISGPSGVGKGTLISRLRKNNPNLWLSISATSRAPRGREKDKRDYFFLDREDFIKQIEAGEILEYDEFVGEFYGTPKSAIEEHLAAGQDIILDITVKGALTIKEKMPEAITVFILPPSLPALRKRLEGRGTEEPEAVSRRLAQAKKEIEIAQDFDYVLVNEKLNSCVAELEEIMRVERKRPFRQKELLEDMLVQELA